MLCWSSHELHSQPWGHYHHTLMVSNNSSRGVLNMISNSGHGLASATPKTSGTLSQLKVHGRLTRGYSRLLHYLSSSEEYTQWHGNPAYVAATPVTFRGQKKRMTRPLSASIIGQSMTEANPNMIFRKTSSGHITGGSTVFRKNSASYANSRDCEPPLLLSFMLTHPKP